MTKLALYSIPLLSNRQLTPSRRGEHLMTNCHTWNLRRANDLCETIPALQWRKPCLFRKQVLIVYRDAHLVVTVMA
jgi:hypothetical protein